MATSVSEKGVIDAALAHFRQDLESRRRRQEEEYPRHGKNTATAEDLSDEADYEEQLRVLTQLIEDPQRFPTQFSQLKPATPIEPSKSKALRPATSDEDPFVNPFTGQWIFPNTSLTPGPSNARGPLNIPGKLPDDLSLNKTELQLTLHSSKEVTNVPIREVYVAGDTKSKLAVDYPATGFSSPPSSKFQESRPTEATVSVAGLEKVFEHADTHPAENQLSRPPSYKTVGSLRSIRSSITLPNPRNFSAPKSYESTPDQAGGTLTRLKSFTNRGPFKRKRKVTQDKSDGFQLPPPKQSTPSTLTLLNVSNDQEGFGGFFSSIFSGGRTPPPVENPQQVSGSSETIQKGLARVEVPQIDGKASDLDKQPLVNKLKKAPPKPQTAASLGTEKGIRDSTFPVRSQGKPLILPANGEQNSGAQLQRSQAPEPQRSENVNPDNSTSDNIQASLELAKSLAHGVPQHYESLKWMEDDPFGINEGITGEWPSTPYSDSLRVALELSRGVPQDYSTLQTVQIEAHKESWTLARSLAGGLPQEYAKLQELFYGDQALARQLTADESAHNALFERDREIAQKLAAGFPQEVGELRAAESAMEANRIREANQARELSEQLDKVEFGQQLAYARRLQQQWDAESSGYDSPSKGDSSLDLRWPPLSLQPTTASPITPPTPTFRRPTTPVSRRPTAYTPVTPTAASWAKTVTESQIIPTAVKQSMPGDFLVAEEADLVAQQRERQARWGADARRRQQTANQEDARIRKEREELAAAEKDRQRRETAAKAARRALQLECVVCSDASDRSEMVVLPCNHAYDGSCVAECFRRALAGKKRFTCCKKPAPVDLAAKFLDYKLLTAYRALVVELDTPNPTYCSRGMCSTFIPPAKILGTVATCPKCAKKTCQLCKKTEHAGICSADKDGKALLALGSKKLWQTCPHCKNLVERSAGCLHMTCTCGTQFCYNCGKRSRHCSGTCARRS